MRKIVFLLIVSVVSAFCVRLWLLYGEYRNFVTAPFYFAQAEVLALYPKKSDTKSYLLLKVRDKKGRIFYTSYFGGLKLDLDDKLRLKLYGTDKITWVRYLRGFYVKSILLEHTPANSLRKQAARYITAQHDQQSLASFYQAIFLAYPLSVKLRKKVSRLGISHLIALSGFHLGILWSLVAVVSYPLYRLVQSRFFPYRFALLDVGAVSLAVLGFYLYFTGAPDSLVRAYAMTFLGWVGVVAGARLVDFGLLGLVSIGLILLFPKLALSLSFWLSVSGVFSIFLLLRHLGGLGKYVLTFFIIPTGVFMLMLPIVHLFFDTTSPLQLLSPLLSLLFVVFYPLSALLHIIGQGDMFDRWLTVLLRMPEHVQECEALLEWQTGALYIALGFVAVRSKKGFWLLIGAAFVYGMYLFAYVCSGG